MLPHEFLSEIANKYGLSPAQKEVFLAKFGADKSNREIIDTFHISDGTLRYRLGEIYRKFSISGRGTGKAHQLLSFLTREYQKGSASGSPSSNASVEDDLDALVQRVRSLRHDKIQHQCATMQMLDISRPVALADIYTDVNILKEITSQQWREVSDLLQSFNPELENFDRLGLGRVSQKRVPGLDAVSRYSKLMVLGKPGSGKTTFLQWVAMKCDRGELQSNRVPIFIRLKNFAEDTRRDDSEFRLLNYISKEFANCGIADKLVIETILTQGKGLILLDGLDEVSEEDDNEVITQIRRFIEKYFKNHYIITCRIAAQEYRFQQEKFTDVEVADFKSEQVEAFAKKWFVAVAKNDREKGEATARRFIEKLNQPENQQIRELAVTPILLNLTCLVFQGKGEFPSKRSKLYEQGLNILLKKWDESRGIKRDEVYRNLSLEHKIEFLSQLAAITFEKNRYFFEKGEVERYIADYLRTLLNAQTDRATLQRDSKAVLKSIESQHGLLVERAREIYSFSHLTFQEYLTAREIVASSNPQTRQSLVRHFTEERWREVFLLAAGLSQNADSLMWLMKQMKQQVNALMDSDEELQQFLTWVNQKSLSVQVSYKSVAARAFYFALARVGRGRARILAIIRTTRLSLTRVLGFANDIDLYQSFDSALDSVLESALDPNHPLKLKLGSDLHLDIALDYALELALTTFLNCTSDYQFNYALDSSPNSELAQSIQQLKLQLPKQKKSEKWWSANGQAWIEQLRTLMIKHRNIGHDWQLSNQQQRVLRQYYDANVFLIECLNSASNVTPEVRQEIEDTLLLPITEIEKRKASTNKPSA